MIEEYGIDNSSQLTRVVYDDHIHQLTVTFVKGTKYKYFDVPYYTINELISASSAGSYFMKNIAKKFKFEKVSG